MLNHLNPNLMCFRNLEENQSLNVISTEGWIVKTSIIAAEIAGGGVFYVAEVSFGTIHSAKDIKIEGWLSSDKTIFIVGMTGICYRRGNAVYFY